MKDPLHRRSSFQIATGVAAIAAWAFIFLYYPTGWIHNIAVAAVMIAVLMIGVLRKSHLHHHEMVTAVLALSLLSLGLIITAMVLMLV